MTVRTFAERILFGADIEDKLAGIEDASDLDRGAPIEVPSSPARPDYLTFPSERTRFAFPTPKQLESDTMRGKALHFFANHELLALELMALVLLRFPDAPAPFRTSLLRTMLDEQKHLRLYRARMNALGVELGDVPVNDYFWRTMKGARSPLDFMISMSLTFEQANLDFTRHYAELTRKVGDEATASVLDEVYRDEIRHVRHGVAWLDRAREADEDDWDAYQRLLVAPLSPARAKGPAFDAEGRRRAGLSDRFIRELSVFSRSKGRPPVVYAFDAACEDAIAGGPKYTPPKAVLDVEHDLAPLMLFLAAEEDVVIVPERPSTPHLERLADAGFWIPELRELGETLEGPFAGFTSWGSSPRSEALVRRLGLFMERTPPELFSKRFSLELRRQIAPDDSAICTGAEEALRHARSLFAKGHRRVVAKALYSSSGRHRVFLESGELEANVARWLEGKTVLVEAWLERVRDLSLSIDVGERRTERVSFDRFLTDARGRYRGHVLAPPLYGLDLEPIFRRIDLFRELDSIAERIGRALRDAGYLGPAGVDMLLHLVRGQLEWQPVLEVNPRLTMGFVARALRRRIAPGSYGVWLHAPIDEVRSVEPRLEVGPRGIVCAALPTNDLEQARAVGTILYVEPDLAAIEALCRSR